MRKVNFKVYEKQADGKNDWSEYTGVFHQWGVSSEETGDGVLQDSIAIVETEDGTIRTPAPSNVRFLD